MADENVTIRIKINANTSEIDRVRAKLAKLCAEAKACDETFDRLGRTVDKSSDSLDNMGDSAREAGEDSRRSRRDHDSLEKSIKKVGKSSNELSKILKTSYKFAFIGAGIETVALTAALSSVNGLLATGRFLVKGYQVAMSALAKGAAGAAAALATVAAAQRQYIAATGSGRYGGSFEQSSRALRTMQGDARLAAVGLKGLSSAYAAASKNARVTGATTSGIAGLMDFAYLSGDVEKGITSVANLVSLLQSGKGAGSQALLDAAKEIGPEFEKQYKEVIKGGKVTSDELIRMFSSGQFSKMANVAGTADNVNRSLMGQLKAFMTEAQVMFGDLGMQFIEPVQEAFAEIRRIMVRTFTAISPLVADFAEGTMLGKIVKLIDKLSMFTVKLMQEYVPKTQNFFEKLSSAWNKFVDGFDRFNAYLRRFSEASKIVNRFLRDILGAIGSGLKTNFEAFGEMIVDNRSDFDKFGKSIANLITKIFELFNAIRTAFMQALPAIVTLADTISKIVGSIADLIKMLAGLGGGTGLGGLAGLGLPLLAGLDLSRRAKGKEGMGGKKMLGIVGGGLALAGLGQIPGVGGAISSAAGTGLLASMFAPTMNIGGKATSLALPVGVGAAAASLTNSTADLAYRASDGNMAAAVGAGAGAGLLGGAATGAVLGSVVPVIGTGAGAVVGAFVGAASGAIMGILKDGKYKKQAREAAKQFVEDYSASIEDSLKNNDIKGAEKMLNNFAYEANKMANQQVKEGTARAKAEELFTSKQKQYKSAVERANARLNDLISLTGKSSDQILELANAAGVSLADSMLSLQDILTETGIAAGRFGEDFKNAMTNVYASAVSEIQTALDALEAPKIINELARSLSEKIRAGTATNQDFASFFQGAFQEQLLASGGDATKALSELYRLLGPGGAQYSQKGGIFYGLESQMTGTGEGQGGNLLNPALAAAARGTSEIIAQNLVSQLAAVGYKPSGQTMEQLVAKFSALPIPEILRIAESVSTKGFISDEGGVAAYGRQGMYGVPVEDQLASLLGPEFASLTGSIELQKTEDALNRQSDLATRTSLSGTTRNFNTAVTEFGRIINQDLTTAISKIPTGDTSTPRRTVVDTLNTHKAFDLQIAGNRSVTSSLRFGGLGSMDSDHAAGRAYDLVGQNLGMYGQAIRNAGGFAEFHGTGGSRHLHVVPPSGPVGDTATPYMGGTMTAPVANNTTTVNLVVNASPNQDVRALADEIMYRIEQETRSRNERY